ncbi:MAG: GNAT family N-acetyltransferase [Phototrophicales bacterium]|nr:MAG: GNAT family N-acetyltransferase [Phototrophicales bacterium]RMG72912.1 MAG: GNAT family N-acetyltransferase [Chloroflexota bacterium]
MIHVERATEEDINAMCLIDRHTIGDDTRFAKIAHAVGHRQALIAKLGWDKVGFAILNRHFFDYTFIELLVVHSDYRRQGVASALMTYAEKTCPDDRLFTSTNQSNTAMQALLNKRGYIHSGTVAHLDESDPKWIYVKFLK